MSSYTENFTSVNGDVTDASELEAEFDAIATAVNSKMDVDGTTAMTGDLDMGSNNITALAAPTNANDAVTKTYTDTRSPFAAGSDILWRGGTVPTGWAIRAINDRAVRIVNTADTSGYPNGGSPGVTFTTAFHATRTTTATASGLPAHTHTLAFNGNAAGTASIPFDGNNSGGTPGNFTTASAGSGSSHTHTTALGVLYEDFVVIRKS